VTRTVTAPAEAAPSPGSHSDPETREYVRPRQHRVNALAHSPWRVRSVLPINGVGVMGIGRLRLRRLMGAVCLLALALALQLVTAGTALAATLAASPPSGLAGSNTVLSGSGFDPLLPISLCWDASGCADLGTASPQPSGGLNQPVRVPADALPGGHVIYACQLTCASTSFEVLDTPTTTVSTTTTTTLPPTTTTQPPTTTTPSTSTTTTTLRPTTTTSLASTTSTNTVPSSTSSSTTTSSTSTTTTTVPQTSTTLAAGAPTTSVPPPPTPPIDLGLQGSLADPTPWIGSAHLINPWATDQTPTLPQDELNGMLAPDRSGQPSSPTEPPTGINLLFSLQSPVGLWFWWLVAVGGASLFAWAGLLGYRTLRRTLNTHPHHNTG
jgi:hypothetical protein